MRVECTDMRIALIEQLRRLIFALVDRTMPGIDRLDEATRTRFRIVGGSYFLALIAGLFWALHFFVRAPSAPGGARLIPGIAALTLVVVVLGLMRIYEVLHAHTMTAVRRANRELLLAKEEAESSSRAKMVFLANMSHEIRTPLNGAMGSIELLLNSKLSNEQMELAETARSAGASLLAVISDLLDYSKIEADRLRLEAIWFDLVDEVETAAQIVAETAAQNGIELAIEIGEATPLLVRGDPDRLRQILLNLVGNALKFTGRGGEVVLSCARSRSMPDIEEYRFEIRDTGIGIAPEDQREIFDSFTQADGSTTRSFGGTGLGLSISRRIVEAMGGRMGVKSEPGRGSTFWFTVHFEGSQAGDSQPLGLAQLTGTRILIVDKNATNRRIIEKLLLLWGLSPESASSAEEGLALLRAAAFESRAFELVLLDHNLPDMDGIDLARRIQADPVIARTKRIMLTSAGLLGSREAAVDAGVDECLRKPVRREHLATAIVLTLGPKWEPPWLDPPSTDRERIPKRSGSVLVAEDNPVNQKVATGFLTRLGYESHVVADGEEAVRALKNQIFDAVLMDCHMPVLDGLQATRKIRMEEIEGDRIPILALTAGASSEDRQRALAADMDDYLAKPFSCRELDEMLARWITPPVPRE